MAHFFPVGAHGRMLLVALALGVCGGAAIRWGLALVRVSDTQDESVAGRIWAGARPMVEGSQLWRLVEAEVKREHQLAGPSQNLRILEAKAVPQGAGQTDRECRVRSLILSFGPEIARAKAHALVMGNARYLPAAVGPMVIDPRARGGVVLTGVYGDRNRVLYRIDEEDNKAVYDIVVAAAELAK